MEIYAIKSPLISFCFFPYSYILKHLLPLLFFLVFWHIVVFAFRGSALQAGFLACMCLYLCIHVLTLLSSFSLGLPGWFQCWNIAVFPPCPLRNMPEVPCLILQLLSDSRIPSIALLAARDKLHVPLQLPEDFCTVTTQWFLKKVVEHQWWWKKMLKISVKAYKIWGILQEKHRAVIVCSIFKTSSKLAIPELLMSLGMVICSIFSGNFIFVISPPGFSHMLFINSELVHCCSTVCC